MLTRLMVAFVSGLAAHMLNAPLNRLRSPYQLLARYAVGFLLSVPLTAWMLTLLIRNITDRERVTEAAILAQLLTGLSFGAGVSVGHAADLIWGTDE